MAGDGTKIPSPCTPLLGASCCFVLQCAFCVSAVRTCLTTHARRPPTLLPVVLATRPRHVPPCRHCSSPTTSPAAATTSRPGSTSGRASTHIILCTSVTRPSQTRASRRQAAAAAAGRRPSGRSRSTGRCTERFRQCRCRSPSSPASSTSFCPAQVNALHLLVDDTRPTAAGALYTHLASVKWSDLYSAIRS